MDSRNAPTSVSTQWPVVSMQLRYNERIHEFDIPKVDDFLFPVLLGWDAPTFSSLVRAALAEVTTAEEEE